MADPIPGLNDVQSADRGHKPPKPITPSGPGVKVSTVGDDLSNVALPFSIVLGGLILAEKTENKALELAAKIVTGLKPPPVAGEAPGLTPGAILLILPQPLGVLPERFFMGKPRVPGTQIYLDPIYTGKKFFERREQRHADEARQEQTQKFLEAIPKLTADQLSELLRSRELRAQYLTLLDARFVDEVLLAEIHARQSVRHMRESEQAYRERQHEQNHDDQLTQAFVDPFFAANGPDP